ALGPGRPHASFRYAHGRREAAVTVQQDALRLARLAASDNQVMVESARQFLITLAYLPEVTGDEQQGCSQLLSSLISHNPNYTALSVAHPNGQVFCSSARIDRTVSLGDRPYFQKALASRDFVLGEYTVDRLTGSPVLPFAYPVLGADGQVKAIVVAGLDLSWFIQVAQKVQLPDQAVLLVVDPQGIILSRYPDSQAWTGRMLPEAPVIGAMLSKRGEGTTQVSGLDGVMRLYAFVPLENDASQGAYVSIGIPASVAFAGANQNLSRSLVGLGLATLLELVLAWMISSVFFLRRVEALVAATRRLAAGDLGARAGPDVGSDELGLLAASFDRMAGVLQQREADLRQAEARYRTLVERIPAVTYIRMLEPRLEFQFVSPQVEALLGFAPAEWLADHQLWERQIYARDRERVLAELDRACQSGEDFRSEYQMLTGSGGGVWVRDEASLLRDPSGRPLFWQGVWSDITLAKQAQANLQNYSTALELSNRDLQDFAYVASHDLQEPLRKIQAFGERLDQRYQAQLGAEGQEYLQRMRSSASRMQTLINDLLAYSRVATQARPFEPVDLNQVAADVTVDLEERIRSTGGRVELGELPVIQADPLQMRQLFQNLIGNALKYRRPEAAPLVRVQAQPIADGPASPGEWVQIRVEDNGIGFDEKYLDRIFKPFQRLHSRGDYEGSGIGLAICTRIVERHHGQLTARSAPGQGATFIVTLPVKQKQEGESDAKTRQSGGHLDGRR
ncbi:MAG TPA: ATP-binding protein, partial [Anaerolineales bacterium]